MYELEQSTPFITYAEQLGMERGFQQGIEQGIEQGLREGLLAAIELGLEFRFGDEGLERLPVVKQRADITRLQEIYTALRRNADIDAVRGLCRV